MSREHPILINAEALHHRIKLPRLRLFDCRFSLADPAKGRDDYAAGHIAGARYAHLDEDLAGPAGAGGRHPLPEAATFMRTLGRFGVTADSEVVVYDDAGGAFALRMWWMMRWVGHDAAALLDGGIGAWLAAGYALDDAPPAKSAAVAAPPYPGMVRDTMRVSTAEIVAMTAGAGDGGGTEVLLDARAAARFRGEVEPVDAVAGHIPGALNLPFEDNLDEDGRFLPPAQLRRRFLQTPGAAQTPAAVVHTCGSGVSACHNLFAMELAGLPGSRLYPGSWSAWISDPARAVACGPDKQR